MRRQRQRRVLGPLLVPAIEFTAHAVSAQTCWAELTFHSTHSSLLSSLLSIPPSFSATIPRGNADCRVWHSWGRYVRHGVDHTHAQPHTKMDKDTYPNPLQSLCTAWPKGSPERSPTEFTGPIKGSNARLVFNS